MTPILLENLGAREHHTAIVDRFLPLEENNAECVPWFLHCPAVATSPVALRYSDW